MMKYNGFLYHLKVAELPLITDVSIERQMSSPSNTNFEEEYRQQAIVTKKNIVTNYITLLQTVSLLQKLNSK